MSDLGELVTIYEGLEEQAKVVLLDIARRLKAGQREYGNMDVNKDPRDYFQEAAEEALDFAVYAAMERLRRSRLEWKPAGVESGAPMEVPKKVYKLKQAWATSPGHPLYVSGPEDPALDCSGCREKPEWFRDRYEEYKE